MRSGEKMCVMEIGKKNRDQMKESVCRKTRTSCFEASEELVRN